MNQTTSPTPESPPARATPRAQESPAPTRDAAYTCIGALIDELARAGLRHICICPGSRSTPLALTCAAHPGLELWTHIDERSAAFFALGLAKATGDAVALVATSGTAVVNFMPAVTEAYYGRVPLVLLTADRPHELRDVGSNQTIDQVRLFGSHVRWSIDLPIPDDEPQTLRYFRMAAARALATARGAPAGPVHLNFPLREPLVPSGPVPGRLLDPLPLEVVHPARLPAATTLAPLAEELKTTTRGAIICGPDTPADACEPILELAQRLGYPVLADPLSGLRTCGIDPGTDSRRAPIVDAYDTFLRSDEVATTLAPDLVIRFGAPPTSKHLNQYLLRYAGTPQLLVDPGDEWRDPTLTANRILHLDPADLCNSLVELLGEVGEDATESVGRTTTGAWLALWRSLNDATRDHLRAEAGRATELFEGRIFQELADLVPEGTNLYVGNSMPIRELDTFFPVIDRRVNVYGNRGVSGIDGVVSSALGVAAGSDAPLLLVIGDLSFYHDLNGLLAAKLHQLDATIVVINNDGGGIFSFLPQAAHPEHFERLFGTPIGLDFQPAVEMYGGTFTRVDGWNEFRAAVSRSLGGSGLHVVEITTDRARNAEFREELLNRVLTCVQGRIGSLGPRHTRPGAPEFFDLNGARYHVRLTGPDEGTADGPPLLLLHGFTGSFETWAPFLPRLAEHHQTIAIDLLGHGRSDHPREPARYRMEQAAADLVALLDHLEIERAIVLGYSMGGRVALHLATAAPERVAALILESASPGIVDDAERAERRRHDHALAAEIEASGLEPFVDYWEGLPIFMTQESMAPEARRTLRRQRLRNSATGLANSLRGAGAGETMPLGPRLQEIGVPTLLIAGELDEKYHSITRELAALIPEARTAIVPDAGHAVHLERPAEFITEVLVFTTNIQTLTSTEREVVR